MDARQFVATGIKEVIDLLNDGTATRQQKIVRLRGILRRYLDQKTIGRFALGRYYKTASPAQLAAYMAAVETYVVLAYGNMMLNYSRRIAAGRLSEDALTVVGSRKIGKRDEIVYTESKGKPGETFKIAWRVRQRARCLGVVDVVVGGLSQTLTYRRVFSSIIAQRENGIDGLIASLREKNAVLRAAK